MELGDRRTGIKGNHGACLHPTVTRGCVGVAPRGRQVHAPGMTPWPALHSLSASDRLTDGRGVGKMSRGWLTGGVRWQRLRRRKEERAGEQRVADAWAQVVAAAGRAGRAGGRGSLGLLAGPTRPSSPFLLFFLFLIFFPLFKFNFWFRIRI